MKQFPIIYDDGFYTYGGIVNNCLLATINLLCDNLCLARENHQLSQSFFTSRDKSALPAAICFNRASIAEQLRGYFVLLLKDCFECLSPHEIAA